MDTENKCCHFLGISGLKKTQIFGFIVIILAIILTFATVDGQGFGILGMYLVGLCLFKGHCGCKCCCHQSCEDKCHVGHECNESKPEKKSKSKVKEK